MRTNRGNKSILILVLGVVFLSLAVVNVWAQDTFSPLWDTDLLISKNGAWDKVDVAFDGERYLVVWTEFGDSYDNRDIYGCFVNALGEMGAPFAIADNIYTQQEPAVAFNGTNYFVVWYHFEFTNPVLNAIRGRLIDKEGNLLFEEVEIHSSTGTHTGTTEFPDVASDGDGFLVVWREEQNFYDYDIGGRMVSADGIPLGDAAFLYASGRQDFPTVCFGSEKYLVTYTSRFPWNEASNIYGTFLDSTGNISIPFPVTTADGNQGSNAGAGLAFGHTNFLVAWDNDTPSWDIRAGIFSPNGALQPSGELPITPNSNYAHTVMPQVSFDGTDWLMVWGGYKIRGTRVSQAGDVLDPMGLDINKIQTTQLIARPSVAFGNGKHLVTWTEHFSSTPYRKYAQLVGQKLPARIDIKPGSYPNSINLGSEGNVPVAIFSSSVFDATQVDPATVQLASGRVGLRGKSIDNYMAACEDVDGDGLMDLVVHVETSALALSLTDVEASLIGSTFDGREIEGKDSVRVVQEGE
jgi:hypothetical protein